MFNIDYVIYTQLCPYVRWSEKATVFDRNVGMIRLNSPTSPVIDVR